MKKHAILATVLFVSLALCLLSACAKAQDEATIWTDKADYSPEETVTIYGSGFLANTAIAVSVTRPDSTVESWGVVSDSNGNFVTTYLLDGMIGLYTVTATDGTHTATATFTDPNNMHVSLAGTRYASYLSRKVFGNIVKGNTLAFTLNIKVVGLQTGQSVDWRLRYTITGEDPRDNAQLSGITTGLPATGTYTKGDPDTLVPVNIATTDLIVGTTYVGHLIGERTGGQSANSDEFYFEFTVTAPTNLPPVADANGPYSANEGSSIAFSSTGSSDSDGSIVSYLWDFGDGHTSADANPSHTYGNDGTYTVTLTVTDDDGVTDSDTTSAIIADLAPTAAFSWTPSTPNEGSLVTFTDASTSYDTIALWSWDFGDGTSSTSQNPTHTYADNGVYTVKLTVTDSDGSADDVSQDVTVLNVAPIVGSFSGATIDEGGTYISSGSFKDPGEDTWSATVDYGDGSGVQALALSGKTFSLSHVYADNLPGNAPYTVTVTVTDDDGDHGSNTAQVTVLNVAPTILSLTGATINENEEATVSGTFSDPGTLDTFTVTIDWGEGSPQTYTYPAGSTGFTEKHKYLDDNPSGTPSDVYTVSVTVADDDLGSDTGATAVTVNNVAPTVDSGADQEVDEGDTVSFLGSFADPGTLDTHTIEWDFGDGGTASGALNPTHVYRDNGDYTVTLKVTDDDGGVGTDTLTVKVNNVAPTVSAPSSTSGDEGSSIVTGDFTFTDPGILDTHTAIVSWGDGSSDDLGDVASPISGLSHTYADNGVYTVEVTVTDKDGDSGSASMTVTVHNVPPMITSITCPIDPVKINVATSVSAAYTDPGILDTQTAVWDWGDGQTSLGTVTYTTGSGGSGSVTGSHTYTSAGIYTVRLTVTDKDGYSDSETCECYIVVYDPDGGFVTGGGWIYSPAGAYYPDTSLAGKATFGFVSKYQKGATVPTGNTEFVFHVAGMNFKSTSYEWLVVTGSNKAIFKGVGTINGAGNYGFMLTAYDGGTKGTDRFRIKIWDKNNGDAIVYDNMFCISDTADPTTFTAISGGSIVVHK